MTPAFGPNRTDKHSCDVCSAYDKRPVDKVGICSGMEYSGLTACASALHEFDYGVYIMTSEYVCT